MNIVKIIFWDLDKTCLEGSLVDKDLPRFRPVAWDLLNLAEAKGCLNVLVTHNEEESLRVGLKRHPEFFDFFIHVIANFKPKTPQILKFLGAIKLRTENSVFIDDNRINREAASREGVCAVSETEESLMRVKSKLDKLPSDTTGRKAKYIDLLNRIEQGFDGVTGETHLAFLEDAQIRVGIVDLPRFRYRFEGRRKDLVNRATQLNFTKNIPRDEKNLRRNGAGKFPQTIEKCVLAIDRFGNHGMIGFIEYNRSGKVIEFVFSCRVLNTGIPEFVYSKFKLDGFPNTFNPNIATQYVGGVENLSAPTHWIQLESDVSEFITDSREAYFRPKIITGQKCTYQPLLRMLNSYEVLSIRQIEPRILLELSRLQTDFDVIIYLGYDDPTRNNGNGKRDPRTSHQVELLEQLVTECPEKAFIVAPPARLLPSVLEMAEKGCERANGFLDNPVGREKQNAWDRQCCFARDVYYETIYGRDNVWFIETDAVVKASVAEKGGKALNLNNPEAAALYNHSHYTQILAGMAFDALEEVRKTSSYMFP